MKIDFWVKPTKKTYTVMMRVNEPIKGSSNKPHDFEIQDYGTSEEAHRKVEKLREAARPLMVEIPMCYRKQNLYLGKSRTPLPISKEAE